MYTAVARNVAVLAVLTGVAPGGATAGESVIEADGVRASSHDAVVGVRGVQVAQSHGEASSLGSGVGAFYERSVGWVELELAVTGEQVEDHRALPMEVMLKLPVELAPTVAAFVGVGPSLTIASGEHGAESHLGVMGAVGMNLWPSEHWGIDIEIDYTRYLDAEGGRAVGLAAGPMARF